MRLLLFAFLLMNSAFCFAQKAEFSIEKPTHKFPKTIEGPVLKHEYHVLNTGTEPLVIADYKVACPCTKLTLPAPIPPGKTGVIKLEFETKGKYYQQDRSIYLTTNTKKGAEVLRFKVFVEPLDEQ